MGRKYIGGPFFRIWHYVGLTGFFALYFLYFERHGKQNNIVKLVWQVNWMQIALTLQPK